MTIICDSREQKWEHVKAHLDRQGIKWLRSKLPVGDYGRLDNLSTVVDRKASLSEVEGNLIQQHDRFRRECERAQENGIRLVVLIENAWCHRLEDVQDWENPRRKRWEMLDSAHSKGQRLHEKCSPRPPVDGAQLYKIMQTMSDKYGVEWRFCPHQDAGRKILELLGVEADAEGGANHQGSDNLPGVPAKRWRSC